MIAMVLLAAGLTTSVGAQAQTWCDSIRTLALITAQAKASGMPRAQVDAAARRLPSAEARQAAADIAAMVYDGDGIDKLPPVQFADLLKQVCQQQETAATSP